MEAIITLTTDFGTTDGFVAAMKGVILGINPQANLVDISHSIDAQDIHQAAFIFDTAYRFFPDGTIHLVIVDPGVGTRRKAIIISTPSAHFIAPDNGVLSYAIEPLLTETEEYTAPHSVELGTGAEAFAITKSKYWRSPVSPTFHGRDIFAPVAAYLSLGVAPAEMGQRIKSVVMLPLFRPYQDADGSLIGHIVHIDRFGNLVTSVRDSDLVPARPLVVEVGCELISGLIRTYAEGKDLLVLVGSSGRLEIARKGGSAAEFLKVKVGEEFRVRFLSDA